MAELHDLTALELAAAIRSGQTSPTEVLDHTLDRMAALGETVGAFITRTPDLAREQAVAAQSLLAASSDDPGTLPPLLGVPCPIKDLNLVAGVPTSFGSAALAGYVPDVDDGVVIRLREAGTVMVGKTNTPEIGLPSYTQPDIAPPARTPWDLTRSAGGSSGGAAAAVASRIVPIAQGSDGGGSIRIPAAACGLVGLKPSRGRISTGPYGVPGPGLGTNGVLTRDVRDTAAALDVLAVGWPGDTCSLPSPDGGFLAACEAEPGALRIGVLTQPIIAPDAPVHAEAIRAVDHAVRVLEGLGHHVDPAPVPFPAEKWEPFRDLWSVLAASAPIPPEREHLLVPLSRWMRERGRAVSGVTYANAVNAGQQLTRDAARAWAEFDVILMPSLAQPAELLGTSRNDDDPAADFEAQMAFTPWTSTWNIIGAPAISVPLHWAPAEPDGPVLPFGVMLGARTGREDLLLALAATIERAEPWLDRRPPTG
ncbi:amidase [Occultella aeris]|uniref:6-aminohexanoate-cyclic-dimer hydrolase n=1 Tax=Occultella aeris TaxID=2761496 RepID=A0A7M4DH73_9MICO|nr:amidase [Occultella aeris]VZO36266.1 6-aminohexanoate-cyclic-dimer hydrolase [Occultella aeris]